MIMIIIIIIYIYIILDIYKCKWAMESCEGGINNGHDYLRKIRCLFFQKICAEGGKTKICLNNNMTIVKSIMPTHMFRSLMPGP